MAVLVYLALKAVDWEDFGKDLKNTNWVFVAFAMISGSAAFFVRALRWRMLLREIDPGISYARTFYGVAIGNLANCALPFAGEFVRSGVVCTKKSGYDKTLGTIAMERLLDFLTVILIVVLALAFNGEKVISFIKTNILNPIVENGGNIWLFGIIGIVLIGLFVWVVVHFRNKSRICGKITGVFKGLLQGFSAFLKMKKGWLFALYTILIWSLYWVNCICITEAFPPSAGILTLADMLLIMAVGNLASFVPVPGGMGAYHIIVATALSTFYGINDGMGYAILSHESQTLIMISFGIGCYIIKAVLTGIRKNRI